VYKPKGRQIEEVIVTAERQEASIQDTSISITAFTGDFIDDFGIRNQEDLQNFIPATTIQPYDATVRGVGRNFRALAGDPGVATYINGVYSEDLLTATAATFWDVERIEVLRGPPRNPLWSQRCGRRGEHPLQAADRCLRGSVQNYSRAA
jgi:iron complex outermembrane receptor protein